jgi:hypothetical protein
LLVLNLSIFTFPLLNSEAIISLKSPIFKKLSHHQARHCDEFNFYRLTCLQKANNRTRSDFMLLSVHIRRFHAESFEHFNSVRVRSHVAVCCSYVILFLVMAVDSSR